MMWKLIILLLAAVSSGSAEMVTRLTSPAANSGLGIFDGTFTTIEKHPYLVGIMVNGEFFCAGNIIGKSYVITVADCVNGQSTGSIDIMAGSKDGTTGTMYEVQQIVFHPNYKAGSIDYDYAIIQIQGEFKWNKKTKPIKLPKQQPEAGTPMMVAGWGAQIWVSKWQGSDLDQGYMNWMTISECKSYFKSFHFTQRMACAYDRGGTTCCEGDYGDGFIFNGQIYGMFAAASSQGYCSEYALPNILANIPAVYPWIKNTTGITSDDDN